MPTKPFWQSKTIWFNVIAMALTYVLNHQGILASAGLDAAGVAAVITAINLVLRWITSQGLTLT